MCRAFDFTHNDAKCRAVIIGQPSFLRDGKSTKGAPGDCHTGKCAKLIQERAMAGAIIHPDRLAVLVDHTMALDALCDASTGLWGRMAKHLGAAYTKLRPEDFTRIGTLGTYEEYLAVFRTTITCTNTDRSILRTATQQRKCARDINFTANLQCHFATCPPADDDDDDDVEVVLADDDAENTTAGNTEEADGSDDEDLDSEGDCSDGITPGGPE